MSFDVGALFTLITQGILLLEFFVLAILFAILIPQFLVDYLIQNHLKNKFYKSLKSLFSGDFRALEEDKKNLLYKRIKYLYSINTLTEESSNLFLERIVKSIEKYLTYLNDNSKKYLPENIDETQKEEIKQILEKFIDDINEEKRYSKFEVSEQIFFTGFEKLIMVGDSNLALQQFKHIVNLYNDKNRRLLKIEKRSKIELAFGVFGLLATIFSIILAFINNS